MDPLLLAVAVAYLLALAGLALFGLHRLFLVALVVATRARPHVAPAAPPGEVLPSVTVQLPLYDEATVAARLVDAVAALDWPRDRLHVQVLDDSKDETTAIVAERAEHWRARGVSIDHVRRASREGWKAGALAHGLARTTSDLIAVFDADFVPPPDFLRRLTPFFRDERVGLVQARWGHLNRQASLLTKLQAVFLDAHFAVEQVARSRSGRFFNFNGTAGVFRRRTIEEAGGWQPDTLTEDLDLSLRAQLAGWRFVFLDSAVVPGELPDDLPAFLGQQHRWVKGSAETARKLLGAVWRTPGVALKARVEATAQLVLNAGYPLALVLALATLPLAASGLPPPLGAVHLGLFLLATGASALFFAFSQRDRGARGVLEGVLLLPLLFAFGLGLSLGNAIAYLEGLLARRSEFVRTPKRGDATRHVRYAGRRTLARPAVEAALGISLCAGAALVGVKAPLAIPFVVLVAAGFLAVGVASLVRSAPRA